MTRLKGVTVTQEDKEYFEPANAPCNEEEN